MNAPPTLHISHTYTRSNKSSRPQANESFHYSPLCGRPAERSIHWSVHLSLSCPLYLTDEINGKHPERTWTQRCISACQPMLIVLATSIYFDALKNLMPSLDMGCCMIVGCQVDGTLCIQVVLLMWPNSVRN